MAVLAVVCSTEISSGSPPVFHECTSIHLTSAGAVLFSFEEAIKQKKKLRIISEVTRIECKKWFYFDEHHDTLGYTILGASLSWFLYCTLLPAQSWFENNVNSSAQLFSMQSSSSLECTLNWKHSFSSTCRHPPILRVADRASASRSQRSVVPRPWLHVARACTLTLSTQQASLNHCTKSWPGLQLSIWFSFLVAACHCAAMGVVV